MEKTSTNWGDWFKELGTSAIGAYTEIEKAKTQRDAVRSTYESGAPVAMPTNGGLFGLGQGATLLLIGGAVVLAVVMLKD
jgi:hypothetical protein